MSSYYKVYLGLGANLNDPVNQINQAVTALKALSNTKNEILVSSFYTSKPMGPQDQPDYVNAVACIETKLEPLVLLAQTQKIELDLGRVRKDERWGPRTLDIDILLYGDLVIDYPNLKVPHYGMKLREFVIYPLLEIAPELYLPDQTTIKTLSETVSLNGLTKI
ncbi:2-amino-4-hydroxy-6-hydroxymethyldihydropteridine diphosphokinase [Pseudoalteromonas denitrificans]|uniref:2-amino-4-hydroxy-6-hydroxymethyldihydropteridine pyrophosphokinase n=1 Tax=Pseudoalteromonas denitrificans DSM 6059 TaxID=1123010 RepID=A0A1I1E9G0_9GAMM|nr:2-amino-4-hydroxy-6-hydroxymethyldihydropteridine diphosphokinase [Pseudoalteromonas denitrificans]SFB81640.1 2-amino-4-hydroxy-6-hydroxymethyldihydropteridinediphosphokinase [Pseudoalteromonas denitrificans DSM 6059]